MSLAAQMYLCTNASEGVSIHFITGRAVQPEEPANCGSLVQPWLCPDCPERYGTGRSCERAQAATGSTDATQRCLGFRMAGDRDRRGRFGKPRLRPPRLTRTVLSGKICGSLPTTQVDWSRQPQPSPFVVGTFSRSLSAIWYTLFLIVA
jgi:hypothetical protein